MGQPVPFATTATILTACLRAAYQTTAKSACWWCGELMWWRKHAAVTRHHPPPLQPSAARCWAHCCWAASGGCGADVMLFTTGRACVGFEQRRLLPLLNCALPGSMCVGSSLCGGLPPPPSFHRRAHMPVHASIGKRGSGPRSRSRAMAH